MNRRAKLSYNEVRGHLIRKLFSGHTDRHAHSGRYVDHYGKQNRFAIGNSGEYIGSEIVPIMPPTTSEIAG